MAHRLVTNTTQLPDFFVLVRSRDIDVSTLQEKTGRVFGDLYIFQKAKWEILALEVII